MVDHHFKCSSLLFPTLLTYCLLLPPQCSARVQKQKENQVPRKHITLEVKRQQAWTLKLVTHWSVKRWGDKGMQIQRFKEKKRGAWACHEETINAWVCVEAVRTLEHHLLSLRFHWGYQRIALMWDTDVQSVWGSADFKIYSANNYQLVVLLLWLSLINTATRP